VLIGKSSQLEKKDAAKSKIDAAKSTGTGNKTSANAFAPRHGPAQLCRALSNEMPAIHIYNLVYEDIKVKNKYFAMI
jgi:hypothetical protein